MLALVAACCAVVCFAGGLAGGGVAGAAAGMGAGRDVAAAAGRKARAEAGEVIGGVTGVGAGGTAAQPKALPLALIQIAGGAALGWLTGWLLSLTPAETAALILIGAAPGTIAAAPLVTLAGGDLMLARATTALGGLAAPLALALLAMMLGEGGRGTSLYLLIVAAIFPAFAGSQLGPRLPASVHRAAPIVAGLALAVLILGGLIIGTAGAALWPLAGGTLVLAVALTLLGQGTGTALGLSAPGTTTVALTLPMRNIAVPMLAGIAAGLTATPLAAALYGILMYLPPLALVIRRARRR